MKLPSSQEIEKVFLASLIRYPQVIPDYLEHLGDDLVHFDVHKVILGAIRNEFKVKKTIDPTIIAAHISNIGLQHQEGVDVPDYVVRIASRSAVAPDAIPTYFRDCMKYKFARAGITAARKAEADIHKSINGSIVDLVTVMERGLTNVVSAAIHDEHTPVDVYDGMPEFLETLAVSREKHGIATPFRTWNRWWGMLTPGDLSVIVAGPKTGKSTILNYIADCPFSVLNEGLSIKVLILDTELETERVKTRKAAALSHVNESLIKTGGWQKTQGTVDAVQSQFGKMEKRKGRVKHVYVANVPIDKIRTIVKRWKATETEKGDLCLVIYDYLKITGEKIDDSNKEWQVLGAKADELKKIMSETGCSGLCAVQATGSDVAASQRIKWFASNIYLFRKFTPEELSEWGDKFGTHCLSVLETRNLGPDWEDEQYVKEIKPNGVVWQKNWLNLEVKDFDMKEKGTRKDIIEASKEQLDIKSDKGGDEDIGV